MSAKFKIVCSDPNALLRFDKKNLKKIMRQAGAEVSNFAKAAIRGSGGGRRYGAHIASIAGNAPASETGNLIRSVKSNSSKSGLGVSVSAKAPYAVFLEAGVQYQTSSENRPVRKHIKRRYAVKPVAGMTTIMPRPFISAALDSRKDSLRARIVAAVDQGIAFTKVKPPK